MRKFEYPVHQSKKQCSFYDKQDVEKKIQKPAQENWLGISMKFHETVFDFNGDVQKINAIVIDFHREL